jgi:hypothetical protein
LGSRQSGSNLIAHYQHVLTMNAQPFHARWKFSGDYEGGQCFPQGWNHGVKDETSRRPDH